MNKNGGGNGREPKVFVIVAVYNRKKISLAFVDHIRKQSYDNLMLIVIDDLSTDGTYENLLDIAGECPKLTIIRTQGNAWWGGCMSLAIDYILKDKNLMDNDLVLFMNDDVTFSSQLVAQFVTASIEKKNAILSAVPLHGSYIRSIGSSMISWPLAIPYTPYRGKSIDSISIPDFVPIDFQYAHATLYPITVIRSIGNIAYKQLPHYHGDGEYSYRAKRYGFRSYVVKSIHLTPDTDNTGMFNSTTNKHSFKELWDSFSRFKSINNARHRWEFAKLCCPPLWRPTYFASEIVKSILRSLLIIIKSRFKSLGPVQKN
jgi:GT2 family glycosyltransferase